ncbi:MAG: AbrB/MazE/SpoVT family DNA-binding domain-containing protein [Chloroflexota bacterium]
MDAITVSPKFLGVIPHKVRQMLRIKSGQKMQVIAYNNRIVMIPVLPIHEARGSLKGMDTNIEREEEDRV